MQAVRTMRPRGFTLLEAVVTLVIIGIMLAFALPQLGSASMLAKDSQAKATATGAMTAVVTQYGRTYTSRPWEEGDSAFAASALCATEEYYRFNARPPAPVVDPNVLSAFADVQFLGGAVASTQPGTASVSTVFVQTPNGACDVTQSGDTVTVRPTAGYWQVGVATAAEMETGPACWVMSHKVNPAGDTNLDRFILITDTATDNADVTTFCTGEVAAWLVAQPMPSGRGQSWTTPWTLDIASADDLGVLQQVQTNITKYSCIGCVA